MTDRLGGENNNISKSDLETILQVNKKAIEIGDEVSVQNEEILDQLSASNHTQENIVKKIDKTIEQNESISRDLFIIKAFFVLGGVNLILQVITLILHK
jgi:hypothetical protein